MDKPEMAFHRHPASLPAGSLQDPDDNKVPSVDELLRGLRELFEGLNPFRDEGKKAVLAFVLSLVATRVGRNDNSGVNVFEDRSEIAAIEGCVVPPDDL